MKKIFYFICTLLIFTSCTQVVSSKHDKVQEIVESCDSLWFSSELGLRLHDKGYELVDGVCECSSDYIFKKGCSDQPLQVCIFKKENTLKETNMNVCTSFIEEANNSHIKEHPETYKKFKVNFYQNDEKWTLLNDGIISSYRFQGKLTNSIMFVYCKDNLIILVEIHNYYNYPNKIMTLSEVEKDINDALEKNY